MDFGRFTLEDLIQLMDAFTVISDITGDVNFVEYMDKVTEEIYNREGE